MEALKQSQRDSHELLPENEKVPPDVKIDGSDTSDRLNTSACGSPVVVGRNTARPAITTHSSEKKSSSDRFYERLSKFYESSGLSLVFNFRETSLDLYLFYKEVTERGGFYQVAKDGNWGEIASTLNLKSAVLMSLTQLQNLYANLLYQFEQTYFYRTNVKPVNASDGSTNKRKHCNSSSTVHSGIAEDQVDKRKCTNISCQVSTESGATEQKASKSKDMKKEVDSPQRPRTSYQIFLKKECFRLKMIHGDSSGSQNIRNMAIDAWRYLSESERQPYIEESKKERERFKKEKAALEHKNLQSTNTDKSPTLTLQIEGDYHVTLQPNAENLFVADETAIDLAAGVTKNARQAEPLFQINWDDYSESLGISS